MATYLLMVSDASTDRLINEAQTRHNYLYSFKWYYEKMINNVTGNENKKSIYLVFVSL